MKSGTVTRKMDAVLESLGRELQSLYGRKDFERKIAALKRAGGKSNRPSILAELFIMLDACGIAYERGREDSYYENLVKMTTLPTFSDLEDKMLYALYTSYQEYPSPEMYMHRIVDHLSFREDGWDEQSLRVRILKQFIKYGNYLDDLVDSKGKKIVGGKKTIRDYVKGKLGHRPDEAEILRYVDDGIFFCYQTQIAKIRETSTTDRKNVREQIKALGKLSGKFGLLKLADDLAAGKFRTEGATKRSLYWFAMVYGMTYFSEAPGEICDNRTDMEKNLFADYYTNNLMRFLSDAYKGRLCEYELDPSGQGINYKNFAEMINLYYIASPYPPPEKLRRSAEMINRVQNRQSVQEKENRRNIKDIKKETSHYRSFFKMDQGFGENVFGLSEEQFEQFVCENYDCSAVTKDGRKVGELQMEKEQYTAFENYQSILERLEALGIALENCNYGLWFTDVAATQKKGYQTLCDRMPEIDRERFDEFMELLLSINSFLGYTVSEETSSCSNRQERTEVSRMKTKALFVDTPNHITRTSMVVAYYYYYNALHENDACDHWKNFGALFYDFKKGIDLFLVRSYYQPLSGKNIFDVAVVFSSYAYLCM